MAAVSLHTANLVLERKIKGHLPITRLAVTDTGTVMVVIPDDHQPRLYHLISLSAAGEYRDVGSFSVEKLQEIDFSDDARIFVATTDDDVYVFRDNSKKRFFPERRDNYTSLSVAASGEHFAVGSADMILSSFSVTLAKTKGGQVWVKDLPFSATSMRISDDASKILVGSEDGMAVMLDEFRMLLWQFEGNDPITALGMSSAGDVSIVGTRGGQIHVIGDGGIKLWEAERDGRIVDCAMSLDGKLVAVARSTSLGGGVVEFFCDDGAPILEHSTVSEITSVAYSPSGGYAAISCDDGCLQVLEIASAPGRSCTDSRARSLREMGMTAADKGENAFAVDKLTEYLKLCPADAEACAKLVEASVALIEHRLAEAERLASEGDTARAARELQAACALLPYDRRVFDRTTDVREKIIADSLAQALSLATDGHMTDAIAKAEEIIGLDFVNSHAREVLSMLEGDLVAGYLADADAATDSGRHADAVGILEKAVAIQPTREIREQLAHARARQAIVEGQALYEAKKFSQAVFQFRKALSIDPDNPEAQKYIEYSESLRQDDMLFDRFSKLE